MKFVIMAGGVGSKLWPISREDTPKQFSKIISDKSLFQMNVEGLLRKYKPEDIFVSITEAYVHFVREQAPEIPEENYIIEPNLHKDTGPASGYAMLKVAQRYPNEVVMFYVQPVVVRTPVEKYIEMIEGIENLVNEHNMLVTGGKIPTHPEVGSDLMKLGKQVKTSNGNIAYIVDNWIDVVQNRMTLEEVTEICTTSTVCLHTNHYTWNPEGLMNAYKEVRPDWHAILMEIKEVLGTPDEYEKVKKIYAKFEPGRIELLTRQLFNTQRAIAVILPFQWTHITTWDDIYRYSDDNGIETEQANVLKVESEGNLIRVNDKKLVALVGVNDMVVVETEDALFICPRGQVSKIKALYDQLKEEKYSRYL